MREEIVFDFYTSAQKLSAEKKMSFGFGFGLNGEKSNRRAQHMISKRNNVHAIHHRSINNRYTTQIFSEIKSFCLRLFLVVGSHEQCEVMRIKKMNFAFIYYQWMCSPHDIYRTREHNENS